MKKMKKKKKNNKNAKKSRSEKAVDEGVIVSFWSHELNYKD